MVYHEINYTAFLILIKKATMTGGRARGRSIGAIKYISVYIYFIFIYLVLPICRGIESEGIGIY
ncbi:MAG: hypothetical protein DRO40_06620 [Thermoprotei archaeon]|nr:MAG: hypothetical protein DRO40_06620 [Thermoprotei archaeon]